MRETKNSGIEWIGDIPNDWSKNKTIRLFSVIGSGTTPKSEDENNFSGEINWIQSGDINGGFLSFCKNQISDEVLSKYSALKVYKAPFIVIAMYGASIGNLSISNIDACVNQACCVLSETENDFNYLFYAIKAAKDYLIRKAVGGGQPNISQDTIKQLWLPQPSLEQQKKIADFLDEKCSEIDTVIEKTKATIEEYKKLKQSVITQTVTKGLRSNRPMKDSGIEWIGEISEDFYVYRMKHLLKSCLLYGANESGVPYEESLPRYIRITDITIDGKLKDSGKLSLTEESAKGYFLKDGDVLFARSGATVGKAFIYRKEYGRAAFAGYLIKATVSDKMLPDYLFFYTQSSIYEEWKKQIFVQATIQNIGADRYNELPIVIQSLDEQKEIVNYLDKKCSEIDELIAKKTTLLSELESYKKSLIYEYVTGKKEV